MKKVSFALADFDRRFRKMYKYLTQYVAARGYDMEWVNDVMKVIYLQWGIVYEKWLDKQNRTPVITAQKNEMFKKAKKVYSDGARMIKANRHTTEAELVDLEIPFNPGGSHDPIHVTVTLPEVTTDTSIPKSIGFSIKEKGKKRLGKPAGGKLIGMRSKIVKEYPNNVDELGPMQIFSTSNFRIDFPQADQGEMLAYTFCWISPTGEVGEWTRIETVFIP
jgi:hypothetical protein